MPDSSRERFEQIKDLFIEARDQPAKEVEAWLTQRCGDDQELQQQVESLLRHDVTQTMLPNLALRSPTTNKTNQPPRFEPGRQLTDRYRVGARLGYGGMGEVYHADDLVMNQPVAVKVLHPHYAQLTEAGRRLIREAKLARRVTHRNVVRVFDASTFEGDENDELLISMELLHGQTLREVFRRGQVQREEALTIARQLCAGLTAAHESGVLHRDLKPGNIMVEADGRVALTDFGIAAGLDPEKRLEAAGTLQYLAPEVAQGEPSTVQSDLYGLGMVLFELMTGQPAYDGKPWREDIPLSSAASQLRRFEPRVEAMVRACIHPDQSERPRSCYEVWSALGEDPLLEAVKEQRLIDPGVLSAAGESARVRRKEILVAFAVFVVALIGVIGLAEHTFLVPRAGLESSPEQLQDRALHVIQTLEGQPDDWLDHSSNYLVDPLFIDAARNNPELIQGDVLAQTHPSALLWEHRQGESRVVSQKPLTDPYEIVRPPIGLGGVRVRLDMRGHLVRYYHIPRQWPGNRTMLDWSPAFELAGLDFDKFVPANFPDTVPVVAEDVSIWKGPSPTRPGEELRVEAAHSGGKIVYFNVHSSLTPVTYEQPSGLSGWQSAARALIVGLALFSGGFLAWQNQRLGLTDRRVAVRLFIVCVLLGIGSWFLITRHVKAIAAEMSSLYTGVSMAVFQAVAVAVIYLAFEPLARRNWPKFVMGWKCLWHGHVRSPLVGRELLIGLSIGTGLVLAEQFLVILGCCPTLLPSMGANLGPGGGPKLLATAGITATFQGISRGMLAAFTLLLLHRWLRKAWLANGLFFGASVLLITALLEPHHPSIWLWTVIIASLQIIALLSALRFAGLLGGVMSLGVAYLISAVPINADISVWYASTTFLTAAILSGLALYASWIALTPKS